MIARSRSAVQPCSDFSLLGRSLYLGDGIMGAFEMIVAAIYKALLSPGSS